jgi:hypothetical protein
MPWTVAHFDGLEQPFVDQNGEGELTVPAGHRVLWNESLPRPEMDQKRTPQSEVYPDGGKQSGVGFLPYAKFQWWCYTQDPVVVGAGLRTRASAAVMIVSHGIGGDNAKAGACGMRVGVSAATEYDPLGDILWSDWWVVRDNLTNERVWHKLETPEYVPQVGQVRLWVQCNADVAAAISAGHWDAEMIEQWTDEPGPGAGVTKEEVIELIGEIVPGLIRMHAPIVIADQLRKT